jgi:hypothetical protein
MTAETEAETVVVYPPEDFDYYKWTASWLSVAILVSKGSLLELWSRGMGGDQRVSDVRSLETFYVPVSRTEAYINFLIYLN